jgi:choline kinase
MKAVILAGGFGSRLSKETAMDWPAVDGERMISECHSSYPDFAP